MRSLLWIICSVVVPVISGLAATNEPAAALAQMERQLPRALGPFQFDRSRVRSEEFDTEFNRAKPYLYLRFRYVEPPENRELEGRVNLRSDEQHILHDLVGGALAHNPGKLKTFDVNQQTVLMIQPDNEYVVQWCVGSGLTVSVMVENTAVFPNAEITPLLALFPSTIKQSDLAPYRNYDSWARLEIDRRLAELRAIAIAELNTAAPPQRAQARQSARNAATVIGTLTCHFDLSIMKRLAPFCAYEWTRQATVSESEFTDAVQAVAAWWETNRERFQAGDARHRIY